MYLYLAAFFGGVFVGLSVMMILLWPPRKF